MKWGPLDLRASVVRLLAGSFLLLVPVAPATETRAELSAPHLFADALREVREGVALLAADNAVDRARGARLLGGLGARAKACVPELLVLLQHPDPVTAMAAYGALEVIDPGWRESAEARAAVPGFVAALADNDLGARTRAVRVLGELRDPRALQPLLAALAGDGIELVEEVVFALATVDRDWVATEAARRAIPHFAQGLVHPSAEVRAAVQAVLRQIDPGWASQVEAEAAVPALVVALEGGTVEAQVAALTTLAAVGHQRAVLPLLRFLGPDNLERTCTWVDNKSLGERALDALDRSDPNWREREEAQRLATELVVALRARVEPRRPRDGRPIFGPDMPERYPLHLARALQRLRDPSTVEPLLELLESVWTPEILTILEAAAPAWRDRPAARRIIANVVARLEMDPALEGDGLVWYRPWAFSATQRPWTRLSRCSSRRAPSSCASRRRRACAGSVTRGQ